MQILMSVMMATFMFVMVPRAEVCAERIEEVLDTESSVVPPADAGAPTLRHGYAGAARRRVPLPRRRGAGAARHRPDRPGRARPPRSSAAPAAARPRCSTWCRGCSTPPAARCWSTASTCASSTRTLLSGRVGLVPQKPYLFSGTVASNLRYGKPDATDEELWRALEIAQARDFVEAMPEGLDAPIAQGGTNVSGGQRQRLAIARALVPPAGDLPVRRLVLRAGLRHRRRAARRAGPRDRRRDRGHRRPAGQHDPRRRPDRRAGRGPRGRHRHARAN